MNNLHKALTIEERITLFDKVVPIKYYNNEQINIEILYDNYNSNNLHFNLIDFKNKCFSIYQSNYYNQFDFIKTYKEICESYNFLQTRPIIVNEDNQGFTNLFSPIVRFFVTNLKNEIKNLFRKDIIVDDIFYKDIITYYLQELQQLHYKTISYEYNAQKMSNNIIGDTDKEKFINFQKILNDKDFFEYFYNEYPVIYRLSSELLLNNNKFIVEIIANYIRDYEEIKKELFDNTHKQPPIANFEFHGDIHNDGKRVVIINFINNSKLVYKPTNVDTIKLINRFILFFNSKSDFILKPLKAICNINYGWIEYIKDSNNQTNTEISSFYYSIGIYQFLFYLLNGYDFHFENIINSDNIPYFIDVECMFANIETDFENNLSLYSRCSILDSTVLTRNIYVNKTEFKIGAIDNLKNATTPLKQDFMHFNNGFIKYERKNAQFTYTKNIPDNTLQRTNKIYKHIIKGFKETYLIFLNNNEWKSFLTNSNISSRVLIRDTIEYSHILKESYSPDVLTDMLDRELLINKLNAEKRLNLDSFNCERKSLLLGNIPYFYQKINSTSLFCKNHEIKGFYKSPSIDYLVIKQHQLSKKDLNNQIKLIKLSQDLYDKNKQFYKIVPHFQNYKKNEFLSRANQIAKTIWSNRIQINNTVTWAHFYSSAHTQYNVLNFSSIDLYNGLGGILLSFSYLNHFSKNKWEKETKIIYNSYKKIITEHFIEDNFNNTGLYTGLGGILYVVSNYYKLNNMQPDDMFLEKILQKIEKNIVNDKSFDILSGNAGLILAMNNFIKSNKKYYCRAQNIIEKATIHLINNSSVLKKGIAWKKLNGLYLGGYSHGSIGIAQALNIANLFIKNSGIIQIINDAINYQNSLFCFSNKAWIDLIKKDVNTDDLFSYNWCNGTTGIGMSLFSLLKYQKSNELSKYIEMSILSTIKYGFGSNHSLCHGDLGNLEYIKLAKENKLINHSIYEKLFSGVINSIDKYGFINGLSKNYTNFGLMIGLSGLLYKYLSFYEPDKVHSILTIND